MSTPASVQTKIADTEAGEFLPTPAKDHNASQKRTRADRAGSPTAARRSMSASPSTSPPRSRAGRSPDRETPRAGDGDREENAGTIFVGNLNHETTERRLREYFETYGRVLSTKVVFNPETGRSKGFGFVKFEDARDADDAIADADGKNMDGRTIKCNFAKYQPHRGQPPHAFRGGRGDFGPGYRGGFRGDFRGGFRGGRCEQSFARGGRFGGPPPFREGGRRGRSRSPGRYSPGRYSPGRYSYDGEDGSPRSRSGSPPQKRRRPAATSPPRGTSPARGGRSRSPDSRSSGSYSSTGSDDSKGGPPAVADLKRRRENGARKAPRPAVPPEAAPPVPSPAAAVVSATAKKELVQAKRREDELTVRLAAMEAELTTLRSSHGGAQDQIAELSDRLLKSEEASKQYKKWLKAMAEYSRALLGAKAAVQAAEEEAKGREEDLTLFLEQAETFLLARDKHRRRRADKEKEQAAAIEAAPKDAAAIEAPPAGADAPAELEEVDMQNGSWAKEEEQAPDDVSAKFKPGIKFKLAT